MLSSMVICVAKGDKDQGSDGKEDSSDDDGKNSNCQKGLSASACNSKSGCKFYDGYGCYADKDEKEAGDDNGDKRGSDDKPQKPGMDNKADQLGSGNKGEKPGSGDKHIAGLQVGTHLIFKPYK